MTKADIEETISSGHVRVAACLLALLCALVTISTSLAQAQTYKVLHGFNSPVDGYEPSGSLVFDSQGNLYGETYWGPGKLQCTLHGCGTVFQLKPSVDGSWSETLIHIFNQTDGGYPEGALLIDGDGNLYGTSQCAGSQCLDSYNGGDAFQLVPQLDGTWSENIIHQFNPHGYDGASPYQLAFDPFGNLYGEAESGGPLYYDGVVFALKQQMSGVWYEVLGRLFGPLLSPNGSNPVGAFAFDPSGNLYGSTPHGGAFNVGVIYKLMPGAPLNWPETVLANNQDAMSNGVVFGPDGSLYGTTEGSSASFGTVFQLPPGAGGTWTLNALYHFAGGADGSYPLGGVTIDSSGNIYGTTFAGGGSNGCGTVFKLTPSGGGQWLKSTVYTFTGGANGCGPFGELVLDGAGNLYGMTGPTGQSEQFGGNVYEITP